MADLKEENSPKVQESETQDVQELQRLVTEVLKENNLVTSEGVTEPCLHKLEEVGQDLQDLKMPDGVSISSWRVNSFGLAYKATQAEIDSPSCHVSIIEKAYSGTVHKDYTIEEDGSSTVRFEPKKVKAPVEEIPEKRSGVIKGLLKKLLGSD